jgi:hypothetical protein
MADTSWLDQLLATQVYVLDASGNPVNIGYITSNNVPCNGNIYVYADYAEEYNHGFYPPSSWLVPATIFGGGGLISMAQYCVNKGLRPSWATVTGNVAVAAGPGGPVSISTGVTPGAPVSVGTVITSAEHAISDAVTGVTQAATGKAAGIGMGALLLGGGLLALVLLRRR